MALDYEDEVPEYESLSRHPEISRYQDILDFIIGVFRDGVVTDAELSEMSALEKDILLEYFIAAEVERKLSITDSSSPQYMAAKRLLAHLHRCYILINRAVAKAKIFNRLENEEQEKVLQVIPKRVKLFFKSTDVEKQKKARDLLESLTSSTERMYASFPLLRQELAKLSPEERSEMENRVEIALSHLEHHQVVVESELNKMLGFNFSREEERERS